MYPVLQSYLQSLRSKLLQKARVYLELHNFHRVLAEGGKIDLDGGVSVKESSS